METRVLKKILAFKKQKTSGSGPSSVPRARAGSFNRDKFLGPEQKERYKELASKNIWSGGTFNINPQGEFRQYLTMIEERNWKRGREVSFSRDIINAYLGNLLTLEEGALCEYGKRQVDVARIISNEIKTIAENGHQLGSKILYTLAFSGLIMGLLIATL
ncbi:hypothetical protein KIW84_060279 [Lathyrus oleraceus]|uniref:Uncharacterized protein n=1 Tax=Pisum sativum TaxID=3888 RepID=A0A9D4W249_PEA|nr:hypothetical protein KIW84_060279 [Pisum sativum]